MKIKVVMKSPVATVKSDATVREAEALLTHAGTRAIPVVDRGRLAGLVHRRDLLLVRPSVIPAMARYEWAWGPVQIRVGDVMRRGVVTTTPEADVHEVARLLSSRGADAAPVVDGDDVVGLVGVRELLTVLVRELERQRPPRLGHVLTAMGGDSATAALDSALDLARQHRAQLTLLHVLPPLRPRLIAEMGRGLLDRVLAQRRAHAREWLTALVGNEPDVTVTVTEGDEAAEVVAAAARGAADLIVVGPATARAVASQAPCPVLAVPATRAPYAGR
jgi:CBS domain-containing protein